MHIIQLYGFVECFINLFSMSSFFFFIQEQRIIGGYRGTANEHAVAQTHRDAKIVSLRRSGRRHNIVRVLKNYFFGS